MDCIHRVRGLILLLIVIWCVPAYGQDEPIRVAALPFSYVSGNVAVDTALTQQAILKGVQTWTTSADAFEMVSTAQVIHSIPQTPGQPETVALARELAQNGIEKYRELDPTQAAAKLRNARQQFYNADQHFVDPAEVADTLLFYSLALLDTGATPGDPLDMMREMIRLAPQKVVAPESFGDEIASFYETARRTVERDLRDRGPREVLPRRFAKLTETQGSAGVTLSTRYVVVGDVLPNAKDPGAADVILWLYDVSADQFQTSDSLTVVDPTPTRIQEAANRLTSRVLACVLEPEPADPAPLPKSSGEGPLALQINLAYGSFYRFPDVGPNQQPVRPFDNVGGALGGSLFLTREFAILAMFQFLTSTSEYSGLVKPGFTTLRTFAGGEAGLSVGRLRIALGALFEGTAVSRITTCPGGGGFEDRRDCGDAEELPRRFLLGLNVRPRISYRLLAAMRVFIGASSTFYFLPLGATSLNFLTTAEAGLQYRF